MKTTPLSIAMGATTATIALACALALTESHAQTASPSAKPEAAKAGGTAANTTPAPRPAMIVTLVRAEPQTITQSLSANGSLAAWQEMSIGGEANGLKLIELRAAIGDRVRKGQVLAVFASETLQAELAATQAAVLEAETALNEAKSNADRARQVRDSGALSAQQVQQLLSAEASASARHQSALAQLQLQRVRLKQTQVLAPDDGVVSQRNATLGAVVPAGQELFRLIRQGRLEWRAEVIASELPKIKTGTSVAVTTAGGSKLTGVVRSVAPTVDPQSRSGLVYVDLPREAWSDAAAKPGMFASGQFQLGSNSGLSLPQQAVVQRDGFAYVFVMSDQSRVSQRRVETGSRQGDKVEIRSGLQAGESVVLAGAGFLSDGDLVKIETKGAR